jgi:hypothetical protein
LGGTGGGNGTRSIAWHGAEFGYRHTIRIENLPVERALLARSNAVGASLETNNLNGLCGTGGDRCRVNALLSLRILNQ